MVIAFREILRSSYKGVDRKSDRTVRVRCFKEFAHRSQLGSAPGPRSGPCDRDRPACGGRVGRGSQRQRRERPVRHDVWYGTERIHTGC